MNLLRHLKEAQTSTPGFVHAPTGKLEGKGMEKAREGQRQESVRAKMSMTGGSCCPSNYPAPAWLPIATFPLSHWQLSHKPILQLDWLRPACNRDGTQLRWPKANTHFDCPFLSKVLFFAPGSSTCWAKHKKADEAFDKQKQLLVQSERSWPGM